MAVGRRGTSQERAGELLLRIHDTASGPALAKACYAAAREQPVIRSTKRVLERLLGHADHRVRFEAARGLGVLRHRSSAAPILRCLPRESAGLVREAMVQALGFIGGVHAREALVAILCDQAGSDDVRATAAEALSFLGDQKVVPALLRALAYPSVTVRCRAAHALGETRSPRALTGLKQALRLPVTPVGARTSFRRSLRNAIRTIERAAGRR